MNKSKRLKTDRKKAEETKKETQQQPKLTNLPSTIMDRGKKFAFTDLLSRHKYKIYCNRLEAMLLIVNEKSYDFYRVNKV